MSDFEISKLYSSKELTRKEIHACGMDFDVYVKRLPALALRQFQIESNSDDENVRARAGFAALTKAIRNEDDSPLCRPTDYEKMDAEALSALLRAFTDVNAARPDDELGNA